MTVVDRFLQYVKFDTQSDELTNLTPSTPGQMIFAQHLEKDLRQLGLTDISLDDNGYLMATLPSNCSGQVPTVGFIAHLDTSPDMSGRHVSPRIVEKYDGGDIVLDFFSGSATTAEAVMRANAEDGGNRRFILVQLPEPCEEDGTAAAAGFKNLCEVGKARIRAVAKDIASSFDCTKIVHGGGTRVLDKSENAESPIQSSLSTDLDQQVKPDNTGSTSPAFTLEDLDLGFRVFKVASSNFLPSYFQVDAISQDMLATLEGNIKHDRSDLDLLFECVLDWHLPLSCPFKTETIAGHQVYDYNDGDLLACFEIGVGEAFVHALAQRELKPLRVVMRDSCFQDSASKINLSELFKTVLPEVQLRVI